jgi:hypothetical protein
VRSYLVLGSPQAERRVTRETKDIFNTLAAQGRVCAYASVVSKTLPADHTTRGDRNTLVELGEKDACKRRRDMLGATLNTCSQYDGRPAACEAHRVGRRLCSYRYSSDDSGAAGVCRRGAECMRDARKLTNRSAMVARAADFGLRIVHRDGGRDREHPVEVIHSRWHVSGI